MRAVVQKVSEASVSVDECIVGEIGTGFLIFLGVSKTDTLADAQYLAEKIAGLRVFPDAEEGMELYLAFNECLEKQNLKVATGKFQAHMAVSLVNDGPVTILFDSTKQF